MSKLNPEEVLKLARLARLKLTDEEVEKYSEELGTIMDYFKLLDEADLSKLEPTSQVTGLVNQFRADEVVEDQKATPDDLLEIAPESKDRYLKVKRMI